MRYELSLDGHKAIEAITIDGKRYEREIVYKGGGVTEFGKEFCELLEESGIDDDELLNIVYDIVDGSFFVSDLMKMCRYDAEE